MFVVCGMSVVYTVQCTIVVVERYSISNFSFQTFLYSEPDLLPFFSLSRLPRGQELANGSGVKGGGVSRRIERAVC